jgi:hypothetical protein
MRVGQRARGSVLGRTGGLYGTGQESSLAEKPTALTDAPTTHVPAKTRFWQPVTCGTQSATKGLNLRSGPELKSSEDRMLWTLFVILLFLWGIGLATSFTLSGFIHLLPLMAGVVALVGTIQRRQLTS